jgi:hypothetical protein
MSSAPDQMDPLLRFLGEHPEPGEWIFKDSMPAESSGNAFALGTLALLAYSSPNDIQTYLNGHGFPGEPHFLNGDNTFGFAAQLGDSGPVFIAYRGTEPTMLAEVVGDLDYAQRKLKGLQGKVHGGFGKAFTSIKQDTEDALIAFPGVPCYFTGHSLGGAITVLAGARFRDRVTGICTFGQPRVGDTVFSDSYNQKLGGVTTRFVNNYDLIPHVPPVKLPEPLPILDSLPSSLNELLSDVVRNSSAFLEGEPFAHVGQLRLFIDGPFLLDPITGEIVSDKEMDFEKHDLIGLRLPTWRNFLGIFTDDATILANEARGLPDHDPKRGYLPRLKRQAGKS